MCTIPICCTSVYDCWNLRHNLRTWVSRSKGCVIVRSTSYHWRSFNLERWLQCRRLQRVDCDVSIATSSYRWHVVTTCGRWTVDMLWRHAADVMWWHSGFGTVVIPYRLCTLPLSSNTVVMLYCCNSNRHNVVPLNGCIVVMLHRRMVVSLKCRTIIVLYRWMVVSL